MKKMIITAGALLFGLQSLGEVPSYNDGGTACADFIKDQSNLKFQDLFKVYPLFLKPFEHHGIPNTEIFSTYYDGWPAASIINPDCTSIKYFLDTRDNKTYAMYVTIACDGGNSFGIIISQSNLSRSKNIVVGEISDGELYCPNAAKAKEVDKLYE